MAQAGAARYRARNPRATPLYRLVDAHFDEVRGRWEERYERRCGFWRGFVDEQVQRYLDCGLFEGIPTQMTDEETALSLSTPSCQMDL